jgi:hypothetical protein
LKSTLQLNKYVTINNLTEAQGSLSTCQQYFWRL